VAHARNGDGRQALSLAEQLHARYPQDPRIALIFASRLEAEGQRERAVAVYRDIVRSHPNVPVARNNLAALLAGSGQLREAEIHAARAVELAPENAQILETHGNVLYQLGRHREALDRLQRAAALAPANGLIAYRTALTLSAMGQAAPASEMAERAIRLNPEAPWVQDARRIIGN
jgi:tetratricopeptide (TPR) repeat protein